jgi:hypothetical protein
MNLTSRFSTFAELELAFASSTDILALEFAFAARSDATLEKTLVLVLTLELTLILALAVGDANADTDEDDKALALPPLPLPVPLPLDPAQADSGLWKLGLSRTTRKVMLSPPIPEVPRGSADKQNCSTASTHCIGVYPSSSLRRTKSHCQ